MKISNWYIASIVGSVVECSPATRAARVRFPDDAGSFCYFEKNWKVWLIDKSAPEWLFSSKYYLKLQDTLGVLYLVALKVAGSNWISRKLVHTALPIRTYQTLKANKNLSHNRYVCKHLKTVFNKEFYYWNCLVSLYLFAIYPKILWLSTYFSSLIFIVKGVFVIISLSNEIYHLFNDHVKWTFFLL